MKTKLAVGLTILGMAVQSYGAMIGAGTKEFRISGRCDTDDDLNISLECGVGYFFMSGVEAGMAGTISYTGSDDMDLTQLGLAGFGEYNYDTGTEMIPFAGATAGFKYWDLMTESDVVLECSIYAGAKYYLMESLSLGMQLQVWMATDDIYVGDEEFTSTDWALVLSTRFYF